MSWYSRYALLAVLAALALLWPAAAAGQPAATITILFPTGLELTGDSVGTLTIRNDSAAAVGLQFSVGKETGGTTSVVAAGANSANVRVLPTTPTSLPAHAVGQFKLEIRSEERFDGVLCVGVNGAFVPAQGNGATIPLSITPTPRWKQPTLIVVEAVLFGILFVAIRWVAALLLKQRGTWRPSGLMGGVDWDLSKSFGSAVGLFAGVIITVTESGLLPDADTSSGITLVGLSLIFAVLILLAPVTYTVFQTRINVKPDGPGEEPDPPQWQPITTTVTLQQEGTCVSGTLVSTREDEAPEEEIVGRVWAFAVSSAITIGAVAGQFWTTYLMLEELHDSGELGIAIRLVEAAVFAAGILLICHFWRTLGWIIKKQHREAKRQEHPRWTPL